MKTKNQVLGKFKTGDIIEYNPKEELINNKCYQMELITYKKEGKSAIQEIF